MAQMYLSDHQFVRYVCVCAFMHVCVYVCLCVCVCVSVCVCVCVHTLEIGLLVYMALSGRGTFSAASLLISIMSCK